MKFVFSPKWFYGIDSMFEIISVIVTLLIAFLGYKLYKFSKQAKYRYLAACFFTIAVSFMFKILTNISVYYEVLQKRIFGELTIVYLTLEKSELLAYIGFFSHRFLFLMGLVGLFYILHKYKDMKLLMLLAYLMFSTTFWSMRNYLFFHATVILMLVLIVSFYLMRYRERKTKHILALLMVFSSLLLSQLSFIFVALNIHLYVVGEILQLIGFLVLLYYFVMVLRK